MCYKVQQQQKIFDKCQQIILKMPKSAEKGQKCQMISNKPQKWPEKYQQKPTRAKK